MMDIENAARALVLIVVANSVPWALGSVLGRR